MRYARGGLVPARMALRAMTSHRLPAIRATTRVAPTFNRNLI